MARDYALSAKDIAAGIDVYAERGDQAVVLSLKSTLRPEAARGKSLTAMPTFAMGWNKQRRRGAVVNNVRVSARDRRRSCSSHVSGPNLSRVEPFLLACVKDSGPELPFYGAQRPPL
jgi:hypothetical protein